MAIANKTEKIEHVRLSEIHADYQWNVRRATIRDEAEGVVGRPIIEVGEGGDNDPARGRAGLVASMAEHGQETPVIVRKAPSTAKHKKPYELVVGFRRHDARLQVAEDKGEKEPTIKAEIRTLSDKEARSLNIRENTERDSLSGGDLVYATAKMLELQPDISEEDLEAAMGVSRSCVNTYHRIVVGVAPKIIGEWRKMSNPGKPYSFLTAMIGNKDKPIAKNSKEQHDAFEVYKKGKMPKSESGDAPASRGKDGWMAKCAEEARRVGLSFGRMSRDSHLTMHGENFFRANVWNLLGIKGQGGLLHEKADDEQLEVMVLALEKGAEDGLEATQSEADKKACEINGLTPVSPGRALKSDAPKAKGKGKGKSATAN